MNSVNRKLLALVALSSLCLIGSASAQSSGKIDAAVKAVQPAGSTPENPLSVLARGIIDNKGNVLANGKTGTLVLAAGTTIGGKSVSLASTATLTAGSTPAFAPGALISTYLLTPGEAETIAATTTGAIAGKVYFLRVLTSGTSSYTITFGSNFKSTGTLATWTVSAKTFVVAFLFDGTSFVEVSRTVAM